MTADWIVWILASSFFLALYDLAKKASVANNAVLPVLFSAPLTFATKCDKLSVLLRGSVP